MRIFRSLVAVGAGIGFMMFAGFVGGRLSTLPAALLVGILGAFLGGWMTARLAEYSPMGHAFVLALIAGAASLSLIVRGNATGWYPWTATVAGAAAIVAGGWIRAAADHARGTVEGRT